jgi:hypothetical protein
LNALYGPLDAFQGHGINATLLLEGFMAPFDAVAASEADEGPTVCAGKVIAIPNFRTKAAYFAARTDALDLPAWCKTWEGWRHNTKLMIERFRWQGCAVRLVEFDAGQFRDWCAHHGRPRDLAARLDFCREIALAKMGRLDAGAAG